MWGTEGEFFHMCPNQVISCFSIYIFGVYILHTILINGGLADDNDLQELIAVYLEKEYRDR